MFFDPALLLYTATLDAATTRVTPRRVAMDAGASTLVAGMLDALVDALAVLATTPAVAPRRVAVDAGLALDTPRALPLADIIALDTQPARVCPRRVAELASPRSGHGLPHRDCVVYGRLEVRFVVIGHDHWYPLLTT